MIRAGARSSALTPIRGGLDPVPARFAKHERKFDGEFQHRHARYRPFDMYRVESLLRRAPEQSRWQLYLLLNRVDDDGFWRGRRKTLKHVLGWGDLSDSAMWRRMGELRKRGLLTFNWRGDGCGWVRITGFRCLSENCGEP